MTQEETDKIFDAITSNGCREMDEVRFHQATNEAIHKALSLNSVIGGYLPKCTRVEVIDKSGRAYTNYDCKIVETQMQDEERTLKVLIS